MELATSVVQTLMDGVSNDTYRQFVDEYCRSNTEIRNSVREALNLLSYPHRVVFFCGEVTDD